MRRLCKMAMAVFASFSILLLCASKQSFAADGPRGGPRRVAEGTLPQPRFADSERARKLAAAFPEIEKLFANWVERTHMPGAVMGIIIDGEMVWVKTAGVRDLTSRAAVTADTVFRIASMTKSFTAMAILKLRDDGKLSLDDPVAKYVSELNDLAYPTKDSPALTIRHLLTHSEGFPEDNPWGDRQLAQSNETMSAWMRAGIPFSNAPGVAFEYSNYGFAILGQVVARASGKSYTDYIRDNILLPLGMRSTTFDMADAPRDRIAPGHKWENGAWKTEPALAHGSFGAMGGLWTSARDLARYVAFLMSAFPPRDEAESGPIKRSSAREMQQAWRAQPARATRSNLDAPLQMNVSAYGFGLGVSQDCSFSYIVGHGGGLPGFGSLMRWLPEHGVGLIAMGNVTYAPFGGLFNDALAALQRTGALKPRVVQPSPALLTAQNEISQLILHWDDKLAARLVADNLFLDESAERRAAYLRDLTARHGSCPSAPSIEAENALRGWWKMTCDRGWLDVTITLAPTMPARTQFLNVQSILPPNHEMAKIIDTALRLMNNWDAAVAESLVAPSFGIEQMRRQISAASSWNNCKTSEVISGDGLNDSAVRLACERGSLLMRISLDPTARKITNFNLSQTRDQRCAP